MFEQSYFIISPSYVDSITSSSVFTQVGSTAGTAAVYEQSCESSQAT